MKIKLKASNVLESGVAKQPTAEQTEYGELAINYNANDIALFAKDSNNNIRRIGGSIQKGDEAPINPGDTFGEWYFDTVNGVLYYWDGSAWQEVQAVSKLIGGDGIDITAAANGSAIAVDLAGDDDGLEFDGSKLKGTLATNSEFGIVKVGQNLNLDSAGVISGKLPVIISDTAPAVVEGYIWFDSATGKSFVGYTDPSNDQYWVNISKDGKDGVDGSNDPNTIFYTYPNGVEQTVQERLEQHVSANDFGLVFRKQNNEPSATVAAANSAALTAALAASPYVTIEPPGNTNATLFITETIAVGSKTLDGRSAGSFGSNGLTIRPHSTMDKTKPLVSVSSSGIVENLELIGGVTSPLADVHEVGLDLLAGANRVKARNVRIQYFQKGLSAYNTQNSVIEDIQVKFCPIACLYIDGAENCKFLNCTTDMDKDFTPAMTYDSRNILIVNSDNDSNHNRNLTFQYGINERGNQDLDHCVEKRGAGGIGLNFVDVEMNGGRKSALQCDSSYTLTNAKFTLQGNNFAATTADSSADFTDVGPDGTGRTLYYPNKNTVKTNLVVGVEGSLVISGLNGKCNNQVVPSISSNQPLVSQDFGYRYDVDSIFNSSGGTVDFSPISTEQCIKINGSNGNQGATFGSALSVGTSPMPVQQQLGGRYYVYELYILELVNCTGVAVKAKVTGSPFRIGLETFTPDDPTKGGYFKGTAPIPLQTNGGFELTPAGATTGGSFKVKLFNVQMKSGMTT